MNLSVEVGHCSRLLDLDVRRRSFNVEVQWWSRRIVHLERGLKAMSLPWSSIEILCDLVTSFLSQQLHAGTFRHVLPDQSVQVLIRSPFPRMIRRRKVALN